MLKNLFKYHLNIIHDGYTFGGISSLKIYLCHLGGF